MDGQQVRVNCNGEMVVLQAQPPALTLLALLCSWGPFISVGGPFFSWGYIFPANPPQQTLIRPLLGAETVLGASRERTTVCMCVCVCSVQTSRHTENSIV